MEKVMSLFIRINGIRFKRFTKNLVRFTELSDTFGRNNVNYIVSSDMDQMLWFD